MPKTIKVFKHWSEPYIADLTERSYAAGIFLVERLGLYEPGSRVYIESIVRKRIYEEIEVPVI